MRGIEMETGLFAIDGGAARVMPLAEKSSKGGTRPGHVWIPNAVHDYNCEGLNPFADRDKRHYARGCDRVISRGQRYLRKAWLTFDGCEISSRHCTQCAPSVEVMPSRIRG